MEVLFYGNMPQEKDGHITGAQKGNEKTVEIIKNNYAVRVLKRIYRIKYPVFDYIDYFMRTMLLFVNELYILIRYRKIRLFHLSGFYQAQVYIEFILIKIARINKKKIVYEMRAGGAIEAYENGNKFYKVVFLLLLKNVDCVLVQGEKYKKFLSVLSDVDCVYYPNFIRKEWLMHYCGNHGTDVEKIIKLVYWGRISEDKNIEFIVMVALYLQKKGYEVSLDIIGRVYSEKYINFVRRIIDEYDVKNINIHSPIYNDKELIDFVRDKHFYIFPSRNVREGHSNSLTEAMALGVVPIVSDIGFNDSVVGDERLVVTENSYEKYGELILDIINEGKYEYYQKRVYERVKDNFLDEIIAKQLMVTYKKIIG